MLQWQSLYEWSCEPDAHGKSWIHLFSVSNCVAWNKQYSHIYNITNLICEICKAFEPKIWGALEFTGPSRVDSHSHWGSIIRRQSIFSMHTFSQPQSDLLLEHPSLLDDENQPPWKLSPKNSGPTHPFFCLFWVISRGAWSNPDVASKIKQGLERHGASTNNNEDMIWLKIIMFTPPHRLAKPEPAPATQGTWCPDSAFSTPFLSSLVMRFPPGP